LRAQSGCRDEGRQDKNKISLSRKLVAVLEEGKKDRYQSSTGGYWRQGDDLPFVPQSGKTTTQGEKSPWSRSLTKNLTSGSCGGRGSGRGGRPLFKMPITRADAFAGRHSARPKGKTVELRATGCADVPPHSTNSKRTKKSPNKRNQQHNVVRGRKDVGLVCFIFVKRCESAPRLRRSKKDVGGTGPRDSLVRIL